MCPDINHDPWTIQEDQTILHAKRTGESFASIAKRLNGRTTDSVRLRFNTTLNPRLTSSKWTDDEKRRLQRAVQIYGPRWTFIAKTVCLGRSDRACQNTWNSMLKSRRRTLDLAIRDDTIEQRTQRQAPREENTRSERKFDGNPVTFSSPHSCVKSHSSWSSLRSPQMTGLAKKTFG